MNSKQRNSQKKYRAKVIRGIIGTVGDMLVAIDKGETTAKQQLEHLKAFELTLKDID